MLRHASAFAIAASLWTFTLTSAHDHDHDKLHSHFCEGGGYSLSCAAGLNLRIDRAWYGRIAHDRDSCLKNATSGEHGPDLAKDCGSSILTSKSSWCHLSEDKTGCTIEVKNMLHGDAEAVPCPDGVVRYLYLEYECQGGSSGAGVLRAELLSLAAAAAAVVCLGAVMSRSSSS